METINITAGKLKQQLCDKLHGFEPKLTENLALQVALALTPQISFKTVQRYCSGDLKEVRRIELAEKILTELEKRA